MWCISIKKCIFLGLTCLTWLSFVCTGWVDNQRLWPFDSQGPSLNVPQEARGLFWQPDPRPLCGSHAVLSRKHLVCLFVCDGSLTRFTICCFYALFWGELSTDWRRLLSLDCLLVCLSLTRLFNFHRVPRSSHIFFSRHLFAGIHRVFPLSKRCKGCFLCSITKSFFSAEKSANYPKKLLQPTFSFPFIPNFLKRKL